MRAMHFSVITILCILFSYFVSVHDAVSDDTKACLRCHSIKTLQKQLDSGETISLYIDSTKFEKSIHGVLGCSACHTDINLKNHPRSKKIENKRVYAKEFSKNCFLCHPQNTLIKPKVHGELVKKGEVFCSQCHGSHYISSMKDWKKTVGFSNYCLTCHQFDISKTLPSKERLSLKVNPSEIKKSVHGKFECIVCHSDFSKINHPIYNYKDKNQYKNEMMKICTKCHTEESLQKNPAHYALTKTTSCIECHGYHGVKPAKIVKTFPINQYCLNCHSRAISMKMKNRETLSIQVKESDILNSAHKKLKCIDCHKDFSTTKHPMRTFESIADYRAKAKDICNSCHQEAVQKYDKSVHAVVLKKGNTKSPECLKCHDYHKVAWITPDKLSSLSICIQCHNKESEAFKLSIHNTALTQGKKDAPVCSSCHNAHDILATNIAKLDNSCTKCHKDVKINHNKWLWNPPLRLTTFVDTHFNSASCAACHAQVRKALYLTLIEKSKKKALTEEEIAKLFRVELKGVKSKIDFNEDGKIQENELWQFMNAIKSKVNANLAGRIDALEPNDAHKIEVKSKAVKDCTVCHSPNVEFTGRLEINREDTKPVKFDLEKKAFNSIYAIPNIKDFYVLGTTKISILDILFFIALGGGLAVALGHIALRILTAPIRKKRREEK